MEILWGNEGRRPCNAVKVSDNSETALFVKERQITLLDLSSANFPSLYAILVVFPLPGQAVRTVRPLASIYFLRSGVIS